MIFFENLLNIKEEEQDDGQGISLMHLAIEVEKIEAQKAGT